MDIIELHKDDQDLWNVLNYHRNFDLDPSKINDNVPRIDVNEVSLEQFVEKFEKIYKPVVITGVTDNWNAKYKWTLSVRKIPFEIIEVLTYFFNHRD